LKHTTAKTIRRPGVVEIHQPACSHCCPSLMMLPQLASGGRTPKPRKLSAASTRIVLPMSSVALTITGAMQLGSRCRNMMRARPKPSDLAATE
jgi:hypothetical protein